MTEVNDLFGSMTFDNDPLWSIPQPAGWQLCPMCKGNIYDTVPCRICKNKGIINVITGEPPAK